MPNCVNCGTPLKGRYCYNCGQKHYTDRDKSVKSLLEEFFHFITHFEGKFLITIKAIFTSPGKLSLDYSRGRRKKYYKPVSLFLMVVIIYLLFPIYPGLNMEMRYYKTIPVVGNLISHQIKQKLETEKISETVLTQSFESKSHTTSKFLLFLLIPLSAFTLQLFYYYKKRWLYDDFILATEMNVFYVFTFFLVLPIITQIIFSISKLYLPDFTIGIIISVIFLIYLTILFRKVFGEKWWVTVLKAFLFSVVFTIELQIIYKFILFEITFFMV